MWTATRVSHRYLSEKMWNSYEYPMRVAVSVLSWLQQQQPQSRVGSPKKTKYNSFPKHVPIWQLNVGEHVRIFRCYWSLTCPKLIFWNASNALAPYQLSNIMLRVPCIIKAKSNTPYLPNGLCNQCWVKSSYPIQCTVKIWLAQLDSVP